MWKLCLRRLAKVCPDGFVLAVGHGGKPAPEVVLAAEKAGIPFYEECTMPKSDRKGGFRAKFL